MTEDNKKWPSRIFLCGFMGSGKSTLGLRLADYAGMTFTDLDTQIVEREGQSITEIFDQQGESYFRRVEREMVEYACKEIYGVIALGGGALQDQQLVDLIKAHGLLVYLSASLTNLIRRIQQDRNRPLLLDADGRLKSPGQLEEELGERYQQRRKWYQQAHLTIQTDRYHSVEEASNVLIQKMEDYVSNR